jgi:hypothetical protein
MSKSDVTRDAFERTLEEMQAKANTYHDLAHLARHLVQDLSLARQAEEGARAYESAMYERARWFARDAAVAAGHLQVAERLVHEVEVDDELALPPQLKEAIRRWRALAHFRPSREMPV